MSVNGILVISFGTNTFFDQYFTQKECEIISIDKFSILKIGNLAILKIIPNLFGISTFPKKFSESNLLKYGLQNYNGFLELKTTELFEKLLLKSIETIKFTQTVILMENLENLIDFYKPHAISNIICDLQFSHSEIYPIYCIINEDIIKTTENVQKYLEYKSTGILRFINGQNISSETFIRKCDIETTMINSQKLFKKEISEYLIKPNGDIQISEFKPVEKESKQEEPMTTFKVGLTEKEQEERKKVKGIFHTGVEETAKIQEEPEEDVNDDEGESF